MAGAKYKISDEELGKRLSAGRGYINETRAALARRIDVDRNDLQKWEEGDFGSELRPRNTGGKRENAVSLIQKESGLPLEFFSVDLTKLPDMVTAWQQVQDESAEETAGSQERDEERSWPDDPNGSQSAGPTP